jgi:hypothetical protein
VCGPQVVPFGAVAQHVPGGREHGGGYGDDGLFGTPARAQALELGLQVAALDLDGGPGGLDQRGLEPPAAAAQSGAAALPALSSLRGHMQAQDSRCPGVAKRDISMPISATSTCALTAQAGHRAQQLGGLSKRLP